MRFSLVTVAQLRSFPVIFEVCGASFYVAPTGTMWAWEKYARFWQPADLGAAAAPLLFFQRILSKIETSEQAGIATRGAPGHR